VTALTASDVPLGLPREKSPERIQWEQQLKELNKPLTVNDLIEILGSTVKHDNENKVITFLTMLLTYTNSDQTNIGFLAESSTGKSYLPLELSWFFPKEDILKLGYASPTAFFHQQGEWQTDLGDKRDVEENKKRKVKYIDLCQKILLFLDQPHDQLLQRLRSLLSHDDREITFEITDKTEKYGLRTKKIVIRGFPTVIFCSAQMGMEQQEKTRLLLLSPETNQEKLRESIFFKIERESDREAFYRRMEEEPNRRLLAQRVEDVKNARIKHINIPEGLRRQIYQQFLKDHRFLIPRNQRDVSRLLSIIKGHALLNFMHRKRVEDSVAVDREDVEVGFRLYYTVAEANEMGLSPELYNIFQKLRPQINENGISLNEFQAAYFKEFHKPIGYDPARKTLKTLSSVGLLTENPDPNDRRVVRYFVSEGGVPESKDEAVPAGELPHTEKQNSFPLKPIQPAEICEKCGQFAVEYEFLNDGHPIRRCGSCIDKMKVEGFTFALSEIP